MIYVYIHILCFYWIPTSPTSHGCRLLPRRWEHLHARALQVRAELSTHIHMEPGPHDPHTVFGVFLFEKTKLRAWQKLPAFHQRQAQNAVRHAARSRLARSVPGHRARTRASSRKSVYHLGLTQYLSSIRVNPG